MSKRRVVPLQRKLDARRAIVEEARDIMREQSAALAKLAERVDNTYAAVVDALLATKGHICVVGVGKSGLIGQKISATFSSTGSPSIFLHANDGYHGDLGMVTERETVILISRSGETDEVLRLLPYIQRLGVTTIAFVGRLDSSLAQGVDYALDVSVEREVCPNNLAPTSSTLAALAMGDALAVSLMRRRQFSASDFARNHPGGDLGRRLLAVKNIMITEVPMVSPNDSIGESLIPLTEGRLGLVLVMDGKRLVGLVTDGDLRRAMQRHPELWSMPVSEIMTASPVTVHEETLLAKAYQRMRTLKLKAVVVTNDRGMVTGVLEDFEEK